MAGSFTESVIALDAMGGDRGPKEVVSGLRLALDEHGVSGRFILVGDQAVLKPLVDEHDLKSTGRVEILHASEVVGMDERPIESLKRKKDSSLVRAVDLVKQGEASAIVSCGNTGALMACGAIKLRNLPGVDRPALASVIPGRGRHFVLLDVGANPESTPENLVQNAVLGANYARAVIGIEKPRVGLLSIGTEEGKGNQRTVQTNEYLKLMDGLIDYRGPVEGFQVFDNVVDVVVCDGFTGNVVLKVSEALFGFIGDTMKEELVRNPKRKLGALLSRAAFSDMKHRLNPDRYSGAPLLGLRGNVLKAHGSSNQRAIAGAIRVAREVVVHDMIEQITAQISAVNERLRQKTEKNDLEPVVS